MKTVDIPTEDVDDGSPVETPVKKLRQALLPFQIVSSVGMSSTPHLASKKRKMTDESSNGKITKNLRLEKQNETKENIIIKPRNPDELNVSQSSDENLNKLISDSPMEEDSICLRLEEETDQPKSEGKTVKDSEDSLIKSVEKESSLLNKEREVCATENEEVIDSSDEVQAVSNSSLDLESTDETAINDINKTGDSKFTKASQDNSDDKSSISGSEEGRELLSSTDISTPTRVPNDSKSPTIVLKKRVLSSQKKEQRAKIKEQREQIKEKKTLEKERLRGEKLAEKKKIQQERLSLKLEEKQKKEEERKLRKKQKEEEKQKKEEKKEEERQKKEEERQKKEEERQKKEEERQRKEEEKKKEEVEEEKKKKKAAAAFASFFVPRKSVQSKSSEEQKVAERKFMPFMVKGDMRLAPIVRGNLNQQEKKDIDVKLSLQSDKKLYLDELKEKLRCPKTHSATWPLSELKDEIIIIDEEDDVPPGGDGGGVVLDTHQDLHLCAKLLQFCENRRPPYWGTWRKKSKKVGPRCPFHKDDKYFDYEVDSDDEWEEEEPGESLHGSDDEKESEDEYEVDNDFFVPHGYLSNEEADGEEEETVSPEIQKAKLKLLGIEFEEEMKQKTKQIKPQLLGFYWSFGKTVDENLNHQYERIFLPYKAVICCESIPTSFTTTRSSAMIGNISGGQTEGSSSVGRKKTVFPQTAIPDLIKLIHGNTKAWRFLVVEFVTYWKKKNDIEDVPMDKDGEKGSQASSKSAISKLSTSRKIKELASWIQFPEGSVMTGKYAWFVTEEARAQFGLTDLNLPNSWKYNIKQGKKSEVKSAPPSPSACEVPVESPNSSATKPHLITKFTKVMSKEERLKQLKKTPKTSGGSQCGSPLLQKQEPKVTKLAATFTSQVSNTKTSPSISSGPDTKARKRVPLLVSVPRGQEIPKGCSLASFFKQSDALKDSSSSFKKTCQVKADKNSEKLKCAEVDDSDCIALD